MFYLQPIEFESSRLLQCIIWCEDLAALWQLVCLFASNHFATGLVCWPSFPKGMDTSLVQIAFSDFNNLPQAFLTMLSILQSPGFLCRFPLEISWDMGCCQLRSHFFQLSPQRSDFVTMSDCEWIRVNVYQCLSMSWWTDEATRMLNHHGRSKPLCQSFLCLLCLETQSLRCQPTDVNHPNHDNAVFSVYPSN